jgi:hypothetical protein
MCRALRFFATDHRRGLAARSACVVNVARSLVVRMIAAVVAYTVGIHVLTNGGPDCRLQRQAAVADRIAHHLQRDVADLEVLM